MVKKQIICDGGKQFRYILELIVSKFIMEVKNKEVANNQTQLKDIAEVTEEYNSTLKPRSTDKPVPQIEKTSQKLTIFQKYFNCLKFMLPSYCKTKKTEYEINESELTKQVEKLKRKKSKIEPLLPPISQKTKTLVLDLDQTLVHSSFKKPKRYDFSIQIDVKGSKQRIYVSKRFGLDIFLFEMSQLFELVIYTAGVQDYTDKVLRNIDPKNRIKYRLYREHCTILNKSYFLKNLRLLGRNLKQTILVDDNSMSGMMNFQIFYKIQPFYGDSKDRKLLRLIQFLKLMALQNTFDCLLEKRKQFQMKNSRPVRFFNHNLDAKKLSMANQSTQQSTVSRQENTAVQLVKNVEEM